jgi:hypothetical protein
MNPLADFCPRFSVLSCDDCLNKYLKNLRNGGGQEEGKKINKAVLS